MPSVEYRHAKHSESTGAVYLHPQCEHLQEEKMNGTWERPRKYVLFWIAISLLVAACTLPPGMAPLPRLTPQVLPTPNQCQPLSLHNLSDLILLKQWENGVPMPIVAIAFDTSGRRVVIVQAASSNQSGVVAHWDLDHATKLSEHEIEWIHPQLTRLNQTGTLLITEEDRAAVVDKRRRENPEQIADWVEGITEIWDTATGQRVSAKNEASTVVDLDISPDGGRYLAAEGSIGLVSTDPTVTFGGEGLILQAEGYIPIPAVVAFDRDAKTYAYAIENGEIGIRLLQRELKSEYGIIISPNRSRGEGKPLDLDFDPARTRLALLRQEALEVHNIQTWLGAYPMLVEDLPIISKGSVVFSPNGELLAVGTPNHWQLRGKDGWNVLFNQEVTGLSAIKFNHDGCFIALGFDDGAVEIWGIKQ